MAQRALNKVQLIGNLTRDPELRYTPQGTAVCTLGLATNRTWVTETGDKKEEAEFHRLVAWNKLAEICSQLLFKGRRIFIEGRLQTRQWTGKDGVERQTTEIIIADMIILDSKRSPAEAEEEVPGEPTIIAEPDSAEEGVDKKAPALMAKGSPKAAKDKPAVRAEVKPKPAGKTEEKDQKSEEVKPEDIPF